MTCSPPCHSSMNVTPSPRVKITWEWQISNIYILISFDWNLTPSQFFYLSFQAAVCEKALSLITIGVPEYKNTFETNSSQRQLSPESFCTTQKFLQLQVEIFWGHFLPQSAPPSISVLWPGVNAIPWWASRDKRTISQTQFSAWHIALYATVFTIDLREQWVTLLNHMKHVCQMYPDVPQISDTPDVSDQIRCLKYICTQPKVH